MTYTYIIYIIISTLRFAVYRVVISSSCDEASPSDEVMKYWRTRVMKGSIIYKVSMIYSWTNKMEKVAVNHDVYGVLVILLS